MRVVRCMDTRKRLGNHDAAVKSQFDRNQKLTGILRQNTRYINCHRRDRQNLIL